MPAFLPEFDDGAKRSYGRKKTFCFFDTKIRNGVKIEKIFVFLNKGITSSDQEKLIEYLFNQYGCEGQVVYLEKVVG